MGMQFLFADSGIGGLLTALGIDGRVLLLNGLAFLVVVWVMAKYVFPPLTKALDAKLAELETTAKAREEAEAHLKQADEQASRMIAEARAAADEVVANAREEAGQQLKASSEKAEAQAKRIVAEAREQLDRDVDAARRDLRAETAKLVIQATETILEEKLDNQKDAGLIKRALTGSHK